VFEGVAMAAVYGFFIGLIRHHSGGMLAPVVTHFFADLTIFIILAVLAVP
jgi:membrane protease YdiL (CAAX protease family)